MYVDVNQHIMFTGGKTVTGFYEPGKIRNIYLWFSQSDYWQQLKNNYSSRTDIPALMVFEGDTFPNVGVHFKGNTSYNTTINSDKKSFGINMDYLNPDQDVMGYETLNLNNAADDASFMREILYERSISRHIPSAKTNYVRLFLNGQSWGIYPNVQQINGDFLKDWFFSNDGTRWRADRPAGTTTGGMGGGWGDGTAALNNLGTDTAQYQKYYDLRSTSKAQPWDDLVKVCQVLNLTPLANLDTAIQRYLDLDRTLWFLASEIAFSDDDSYVFKGKMDYYLYWDPETGRITPLEADANTVMKSNALTWSPFYNATKVNYPLLNRLLAVPSIRQRYLAHLRTIIAEEMDPVKFAALIDETDALINADVQADPKKLYTYAQYNTEKTALKNWISSKRTNLLNNAEVKLVGPTIDAVKLISAAGEWGTPVANEKTNVTAQVTNAEGVGGVVLYYSGSIYGNFLKINMLDDGKSGDGAAGDGLYGAELPGFPLGTHLRFYVEAKSANTAGTLSYMPVGADHDVYYINIGAAWASNTTVIINEIMAQNQSIVKDEAGQYEDWIELYNLTDQPINLGGYALSDDVAKPTKWLIPSGTVIEAKNYLVVWADEDSTDGPLHANFKLSASGESLTLINANLQLLDTLNFGQQIVDKGYARVPNGTGKFKIQAATYKANNNTASAVTDLGNVAHINVFPNPSRDAFNISVNGTEESLHIRVCNTAGQMVYQTDFQEYTTINTSDWPTGMYILHWQGKAIRLVVSR
jgi:CotH kinase protein/Lamin Tail Domain/Secretion system C-terminal sorting domain